MTGVTASISEGVTAGTGYDVLGKFASETLSTFAYNALDGKGFSDEYGDMHGTFNWQSFAPKAEYVGTYFGRMAGDYLSGKLSEKLDGAAKNAADREAGKLPSGADDPFAGIEDMLGAAWQGLKKIKESLHEIEKGIAQGFNGLTGEIFSGLNDAFVGLGSNIGHEIMDFGERTGNLFTDGHFASDEEVAEIQARERIQEAIKNGTALEHRSEEYNRVMAALYGNPEVKVVAGMSQADEIRKLNELDKKLNGAGLFEGDNSKAVEDIMTKIRDGKPVDASDLEKLTATMIQKGTLKEEVLNSILNDKEAFEKLNGKTFDFGKNGKVTLDLKNPESIKAYADNISQVYCVAASLYGQMVVNGIDGTPGSFGEFTKQLIEKDLLNLNKPARQINSTQDIIDAFAGEGKYQVVGCGVDAGGGYFKDEFGNSTKGYGAADTLNNLALAAKNNQNIDFFNVRINSPHNMNLYNDNGKLSIYDTSSRGYDASFTKYIKRTNIVSWYYIRPAKRR